ncbi:MAG: hypothetical protein WD906_01650 [Anaerolineales bacterium]
MPEIIQSASVLRDAEAAFEQAAQRIRHERVPATLGYQSGSFDTEVRWLPSLGIWAYFGLPPRGKSEGKRFWNAFGIGRPEGLVSIVCEVNPSRDGINRRTKGAFVKMDDSRLLACHRGVFNIAGGMKAGFVRRHFRGTWLTATEGSTSTSLISVAEIGSPDFGDSLRNFVFEVARIKNLARGK